VDVLVDIKDDDLLREEIRDELVDLIYLDPPFGLE
jgi:16S rRNA G966 N2-methylase RsmD